MGFFSALFGRGKGDERFVSEEAFRENTEKQVAMAPQTLAQLRELGVTEGSELKLEYFFYTNTADKAAALAGVLTGKGYTVEHQPSAGGSSLYVVTGWTTPMSMNESTVVEWTREMCKLGFEHDCDFDGWGTNPEQD